MDYRDFKKLQDSTNELNSRYGNFFGYKVVLYTVLASIVFIIIVFGIMHLNKYKASKEEFVLDSNSKYIISLDLPKSNAYYEIDFSKNSIIRRQDTNTFKREKLAKIKTNLNDLEQFLLEITSDESNQVFTGEERQKLLDQQCYWIYKITNYEQKNYYIKDVNQVKYLKMLLNETYI